MCDVTRSFVWRDSFICAIWLIRMPSQVHAYVWDDWIVFVTWLIHMCDMTHWHVSFTCWTRLALIYVRVQNIVCFIGLFCKRDLWFYLCASANTLQRVGTGPSTYVFRWNDPFICVTWLVAYSSRSRAHLSTYISLKWLIHTHHMTRSYVWRDPFLGVT